MAKISNKQTNKSIYINFIAPNMSYKYRNLAQKLNIYIVYSESNEHEVC